MKLIVLHSQLYLSLNHQGRAIQSFTPTEWIFLSRSGNDIVNDPISVTCGRIVLKSDHTQCLQPSHEDLHDGCEIHLRPVRTDNTSQIWRFITPNQQGYYIIENHNERREPGGRNVIKKSCIDVCEVKTYEGAVTITYHVVDSISATNQRWKIEA